MLRERLHIVRMYKGYTQQNMADKLCMSLNGYQKYEQGERVPPLDTLVKIADLFNVPVDYLLGRDEFLQSLGIVIDIPEPEKKNSHNDKKN